MSQVVRVTGQATRIISMPARVSRITSLVGPPGQRGLQGDPGPPGAGALIRNESGTQLTARPSIRAEWQEAVDDPSVSQTVIRPHQRLPRITAFVRATTNINIAASASTIDGWVTSAGEVIWLTGQTVPAQNGFYIKARVGTVLVKCVELDNLVAGGAVYVHVVQGTVYGAKYFRHASSGSPVELPEPWHRWGEADIDDYYLPTDRTIASGPDAGKPCHSQAIRRALDACGRVTAFGRRRYYFDEPIEMKGKQSIEGLATLNVQSWTEFRFNGTHGIHALAADALVPEIQGGWASIKGIWLHYTGSNIESNDYHGVIFDTPGIMENITVQDFPGHGAHIEANLCRARDCRMFQCGLTGFYISEGNDANAGHFSAIDATACGKRRFGCVKAQYSLRLSKASAGDVTVTANRAVWKDARYGLYYIARTGGTILGSGGTPLDITIEAYDRSLEAELTALAINVLGSGTQFGYGTEYNLPAAATITSLVYADAGPSTPQELMTGVVATNPSGTPTQPAELGDAHGIWDDSFLASNSIGCHSTAPGCRHYLSIKTAACSTVIGSYCEIGNFGQVAAPNIRIGGHWTDPPGMQSSGLRGDTAGLNIAPAITYSQGPKTVTYKVAPQNTDTCFHATSAADTAGVKFERPTGGRGNSSWCFTHSGNHAMCITYAADQRGPGHCVAPRGIITGNVGFRLSSGDTATGLPANSTTTDVWNVGDMFYFYDAVSGAAWEHVCTAKAGGGAPNALTWTVLRNRVVSANASFRTGGGTTAAGLPANSTAADVWRKGDMYFFYDATTGNAWEHICTAVAGGAPPNALTWGVLRNFP